jgi:hypothetical protein
MTDKYILRGHEPVACPNLIEWGLWLESADLHVAETIQDDVRVSTVFLGLDHSFGGHGPPLLFETMVFRDGHGDECEQYCTWAEAETGHQRWVREVFRPRAIMRIE